MFKTGEVVHHNSLLLGSSGSHCSFLAFFSTSQRLSSKTFFFFFFSFEEAGVFFLSSFSEGTKVQKRAQLVSSVEKEEERVESKTKMKGRVRGRGCPCSCLNLVFFFLSLLVLLSLLLLAFVFFIEVRKWRKRVELGGISRSRFRPMRSGSLCFLSPCIVFCLPFFSGAHYPSWYVLVLHRCGSSLQGTHRGSFPLPKVPILTPLLLS